ncbi:MAG TPA: DUF72 domain-containing protein [Byssovorax sp.]|jgi:uncharacterized protein YecE (DUF72 family)
MPRLHVGLPALVGDIAKYHPRFDLLEVRPVDASVPRAPALRRWRKAVPPAFVFSVVLPRAVGALTPGAALDEALAESLEVAAALEARCLLLQTPADVRPTSVNKRRVVALFERVPREGNVVCWEPSGMWEREDVLATAREAGVVAVLDAARDVPPPGAVVYTRLRALGKGAALGAASIERVAERLKKRREAFVVVESSRDGQRVRAALTAAMAERRDRPSLGSVVRPTGAGTLVAEDEEQ